MLDIKDRNQFYQLIAGLAGFTVILIGCLIIMAPFFPAFLLATILTLATWPAFDWINKKLHKRPGLAAGLMTLLLAGCFVFPLIVIGTSIADNSTKIYDSLQSALQTDPAQTKKMLSEVRYGSDYLVKAWDIMIADKEKLSNTLKEYAAPTSEKLISLGAMLGRGLMDITLGVLISYFFFRYGMPLAVRLRNLIERFGGERGQHILSVSKSTLVGVIYGVLGTGLAQALLATIGFWVAGVPGAAFLGLMTFFFSFIPMGPPLLWLPAVFWLYTTHGEVNGYVIGLFIWGVFVSSVDNFLKPYFISLSSDMPMLITLLGVLGGIIAFGFIGVFIGPTILAVAYSLIIDWSSTRRPATEGAEAAA